jgi:hypothetical protein
MEIQRTQSNGKYFKPNHRRWAPLGIFGSNVHAKYLRRTTSGAAGIDLSTVINYMHVAACIGLGTTINYL